jgi:pimeloyl-ACP methyl ester carboxylesterase
MADFPAWSRHFRVIAVDIVGEPGLSEDRRVTLASDEASTWLTSLLDTVGVARARTVGMSLGGWMGLHFAIRCPERIEALSLIAASGLAPQRRSFIYKALPLALLGDWGMRRISKMVCGDFELPPEVVEFMLLVGRHFRPMLEPVPVFSDDELQRLQMPVQFFAGRDDVLLHSAASVQRLVHLLPHAEAHLLEHCGHAIVGKGDEILQFLLKPRSASAG